MDQNGLILPGPSGGGGGRHVVTMTTIVY